MHLAQWSDLQLEGTAHRGGWSEPVSAALIALWILAEDINLREWIVENAEGSPLRLVCLGNRLLACFGRKKPANGTLTTRDLEDLLRQVQAELPTAS